MSTELLPCPFCGTWASILPDEYALPNGTVDTMFQVACGLRECGNKTKSWYPMAAAVKAWNTRTPQIDRGTMPDGHPVCPGCETEFSGYCYSCENKDQIDRGAHPGVDLEDVADLCDRRQNGFASIEHEGRLMDAVPALLAEVRALRSSPPAPGVREVEALSKSVADGGEVEVAEGVREKAREIVTTLGFRIALLPTSKIAGAITEAEDEIIALLGSSTLAPTTQGGMGEGGET